jgi:hypothetical protein
MFHPYTISLDNGKYRVINDNGILAFLRHGEAWPAADDLKHSKVVLAMAQRIEDLEVAMGEVLYGPLQHDGLRYQPASMNFAVASGQPVQGWRDILHRALEQK